MKKLTIEHLWIITVLGICFGYVVSMPIDQYDFWHYIKTGMITLTTHKIVDKEIFTFTAFDTPYINLHWLSQIYYFLLYKIGGLEILAFSHAVIITLTFIIVFLLAYKHSNNLKISSFVTLLTMALSVTNFALRPQEFSILFFALTLFFLKTNRLFLIPLLFVLWANFHGAFIIGLLLVGIECLGSLKLKYFVTLAFSILATLLTPWGLKLYQSVLNVESENFANLVSEWYPPTIHEQAGFIFFSMLLFLFILQNFRKQSLSRLELLTLVVFTLLALHSQRAIIWWAIVVSPIFASSFKELFFEKLKSKSDEKENFIVNWVFVILFICYSVSSLPWFKTNNILLPKIKRDLIASNTPVKLTSFLAKSKNCNKIFNNFAWGSYFMWGLNDSQKIFVTPWLSVFSKDIVQDYLLVSGGNALWEDILNKYKTNCLALDNEEQKRLIPLVQKSNDWIKVYEDKQGVVFKKSN